MRVWVDRKNWHLLRVEQVEANDDVRTYVFSDHRTNKKLDDDLFVFTSPEGADILDRRERPALVPASP